jgi:hypothetical protein
MPKWPFGDIGPCEVTWDFAGTPIILAPYLGTVSLRATDSVEDVQEEGWGNTPVDAVYSGTVCDLDVPLTRQEYANLKDWLPGVTYQSGALTYSPKAGCDMYENAVEMMIKPLCDNVPDPDQLSWIHIFKAHPWRETELTFDRAAQRVMMIHFKLFPDQSSGAGGRVFRLGYLT